MISGIKHESIKQPIPLCNNCPPCSHRPIVKFLRSILFSCGVETVTKGGKDFSYSHARTLLCSRATPSCQFRAAIQAAGAGGRQSSSPDQSGN